MLKKLGRKKRKEDKKVEGNLKKVSEVVKKLDQGMKAKEIIKESQQKSKDVIEASSAVIVNPTIESSTFNKSLISDTIATGSLFEKINFLLGSLEELITDEKVFELSQVVRSDVIIIIEKLVSILEKNVSFLVENEFLFKRFEKITSDLKSLIHHKEFEKDFETLIMSLSTILSQVKIVLTKARKSEEEEVVDLTKANLSEVKELMDKGAKVTTYIDNRGIGEKRPEGFTSIISEEQLEEIKKVQEEEEEKIIFDRTVETQEFLEHSEKIKAALKHKSKNLVSGKFRFLTAEERAELEKEEFKTKFLGYIRKPSIYEMSVHELQRFAGQKGLQNFEGMSRDELLAFIENPLVLYGEKYITQNPYIIRLKMELADNAALKEDVVLAEVKVTESLKAAKSYSINVKRSSVMWQAFFVVTLLIGMAAITGILVFFLIF